MIRPTTTARGRQASLHSSGTITEKATRSGPRKREREKARAGPGRAKGVAVASRS
ncbi:hypothetical protein BD626DRAFT_510462 [Schizophyllum amplum]|uniref:Uncharacterized protein n=1 Tax=Schizophyllum amplum TaxID=97359 RepID=A0A550C1Y9_9AGAR|nr:hypothetical protein BD626DRAFT_510462 [Auriculariopsis ampla]